MVLYAAAFAFALVGAIAMSTDVAVKYINWQHGQKVVDAAALAGANYLSGGITYTDSTGTAYPTQSGCNGENSGTTAAEVATQVACTYAVKNGLAASTITISEPSATQIEVVAAQTSLPYFFAQALGMGTYSATTNAEATAPGPVGGATNVVFPIGLQCNTGCSSLSTLGGEKVDFGVKFVTSIINCTPGVGSCPADGNWDWLGLGGTGSSTVGGDITNGASGTYSVANADGSCSVPNSTCVVSTAPGNKANSGPVKKAFDTLTKSCPTVSPDPCSDGGNPTNIPAGDPCLVIVPAVDFANVNGDKSMEIEGFAEVFLEKDSTSQNIDGCLVNATVGSTVTSSSANPPAFGANAAPTLIQ